MLATIPDQAGESIWFRKNLEQDGFSKIKVLGIYNLELSTHILVIK